MKVLNDSAKSEKFDGPILSMSVQCTVHGCLPEMNRLKLLSKLFLLLDNEKEDEGSYTLHETNEVE